MLTYRIQVVSWGNSGDCLSELRLFRGKDQRYVSFRGDAYWQWGDTPLRNNGSGLCWSQWLHDSLMGMHSTVLHQDQVLAVLPFHADYAAVENLWNLANGDEKSALKELNS